MLPEGKGVYLWKTRNLAGGDPEKLADVVAAAGISFVAIKVHDGGYFYSGLRPWVDAFRSHGIEVGVWGYVYANGKYTTPENEAKAALKAVGEYNPAFYLLDAEAHAKGFYQNAQVFVQTWTHANTGVPMGLNSYWKPSYHPTFPFKQFAEGCDFVCPQVYWRNWDPVGKLLTSRKEYKNLFPSLSMPLVAGEIYLEHGVCSTPDQVRAFLETCKADQEIQGVLFWSLDAALTVTPELWAVVRDFSWGRERPTDIVQVESYLLDAEVALQSSLENLAKKPEIYQEYVWGLLRGNAKEPLGELPERITKYALQNIVPQTQQKRKKLYAAVVRSFSGLNIRTGPWQPIVGVLRYRDLVDVWAEDGDWAAINPEKTQWVYKRFLSRVG